MIVGDKGNERKNNFKKKLTLGVEPKGEVWFHPPRDPKKISALVGARSFSQIRPHPPNYHLGNL